MANKTRGLGISQQEFIDRANKAHNHKYNYELSVYTGINKNLTIICPNHGNFVQSPNNHMRGMGCTKCKYVIISNKAKFSQDDFLLKAKNAWNDRFDYSKSKYIGDKIKILIRCNKHNIEFLQTPNNHYRQNGCKLCFTRSLGEQVITEWLNLNKINYETEKIFITCKRSNFNYYFRFDFYLPDFNLLIEYDGEQHYKQVNRWGWGKQAANKFEIIQERDLFKTNWAKDNGYNLLRIPYFEFKNINKILDFELNNVIN